MPVLDYRSAAAKMRSWLIVWVTYRKAARNWQYIGDVTVGETPTHYKTCSEECLISSGRWCRWIKGGRGNYDSAIYMPRSYSGLVRATYNRVTVGSNPPLGTIEGTCSKIFRKVQFLSWAPLLLVLVKVSCLISGCKPAAIISRSRGRGTPPVLGTGHYCSFERCLRDQFKFWFKFLYSYQKLSTYN